MVGAGEFYTYAEAGRALGVSRQRVWQLVAAGHLGTVVVRGRRYVSGVAISLYRGGRRAGVVPSGPPTTAGRT